jgi:branched-chain amino acid transport system ATP-binding protein
MSPQSSSPSTLPILRIRELKKDFRGLHALSKLDLDLGTYEILGVIGPNGAGKTTLLNLITGLIQPTHGSIAFLERDITRTEPEVVARLGIGRTFQNIRLFGAMSVLNNVCVAQQMRAHCNPVSVLFSSPGFLRQERQLKERSMALLESFGLDRYRDLPAASLPYGSQRRLEIVRALAVEPRLLLLDEPTVGMNPSESQALLELILQLHEQYRLSIVLVAHDMRLVMGLCQRIQVLNQGETIAVGKPDEVRAMPQVIEAYLGSAQRA